MNPKYQQLGSLSGPKGIRLTLKRMASISKGYKSAPLIRETALSIVRHVPEKKWRAEASAILSYCQREIRYVRDVLKMETLQTPVQTLRLVQGDCDDKSMLLASLLMSIGHPVKFLAIGQYKNSYSHVLVQTKISGKWLWADPIMNWPLGQGPKYKSIMEQNI